MSKVKQFHLREGTLVEGKSLGCLNVYLASDYDQLKEACEGAESQAEYQRGRAEHFMAERDQLKADSEVVADLAESRLAENLRLKVENERLAAMLNQAVSEGILLSDQRDTLRKQLDEARELLKMSSTYLMRVGDKDAVDAWLEANP